MDRPAGGPPGRPSRRATEWILDPNSRRKAILPSTQISQRPFRLLRKKLSAYFDLRRSGAGFWSRRRGEELLVRPDALQDHCAPSTR